MTAREPYTLLRAMTEASAAGFKVRCDDDGLWWITTPKRPRVPSQEYGSYANETRAWMAAALTALDI